MRPKGKTCAGTDAARYPRSGVLVAVTSGALAAIGSAQSLRSLVLGFGAWGPFLIIALMVEASIMRAVGTTFRSS